MSIKRLFKYQWLRLLRLSDTPHRIAFGVSLGVFINFSPLLGLHTLMAVIAFLFLPVNRFAIIFTVWANTPWTVPLHLAMDYKLGSKLLGPQIALANIDYSSWHTFWSTGKTVFWALMLGGLILGILGAIISYFISLRLIRFFRIRRQKALQSR